MHVERICRPEHDSSYGLLAALPPPDHGESLMILLGLDLSTRVGMNHN